MFHVSLKIWNAFGCYPPLLTDMLSCCLQVNLVDWLKMMVGSRRSEEVVDPSIETRPSTRALKRALLTALRCVDPDAEKRPKMGQVVRMLESDEPIPREVRVLTSYINHNLVHIINIDGS